MAVDRAHSWAWAMADVKVSLPLCPARMLNACGICAKLELICVRLVLRMCVRVSGRSDCMMSAGLRGFGYGFIYRAIASAVHVEQRIYFYILLTAADAAVASFGSTTNRYATVDSPRERGAGTRRAPYRCAPGTGHHTPP
jgi:hypothetical protein